jgi:hypothetical protein
MHSKSQKTELAILLSDKIKFKSITMKEGHYIMVNGSNNQEDIKPKSFHTGMETINKVKLWKGREYLQTIFPWKG